MDFVKNLAGGNNNNAGTTQGTEGTAQQSSGGGLMGKFNSMAGGGQSSEKNEDMVDKGQWCLKLVIYPRSAANVTTGVDMFQEKVMGQGPQNNESAVEQHKDEAISDAIRGQYKNFTGSDVPIADKNPSYGGQ